MFALFTQTWLGLAAWFALNPLTWVLIRLIFVDTGTGMLVSFRKGRISSTIATAGLIRKTMILLLVVTGELVEPHVPFGNLSEIIALFFCVAEGMSIIENAGALGVPIPPALRAAFAKLSPDAHATTPQPTLLQTLLNQPPVSPAQAVILTPEQVEALQRSVEASLAAGKQLARHAPPPVSKKGKVQK